MKDTFVIKWVRNLSLILYLFCVQRYDILTRFYVRTIYCLSDIDGLEELAVRDNIVELAFNCFHHAPVILPG